MMGESEKKKTIRAPRGRFFFRKKYPFQFNFLHERSIFGVSGPALFALVVAYGILFAAFAISDG
ncbi:MAG: hypothetical protein CVU57_10695 [Deltaproteobacteria bacterium HGW-Deltaproteobacteria-15]|jgi:hypothetical protein|nr:MAG: hypothetical protein CVU57_10695 [Deltaproteobacteria bacterium HGW-Deltaproteobacteria-15]